MAGGGGEAPRAREGDSPIPNVTVHLRLNDMISCK